MFKSFSILCYWLILAHSVIAQQPEILTANGKKLNLLLQAQVFEDKTGAESFTGIEKNASFTLITKPYIQKGFTASAFWIKFSIGNNDKRNWLIELDNKELDSAILYELKDKALIKVYSQGDFIRLKDDNTKDFFPLFQLNIPVGETRNYYLYIKSSSSVYFNCSAWPQVDYLKYLNIRDKSLWLFMGILALRLIYVLILQRFIKERSFTVYGWINIALFIGIVLNSVNLKAWAMPPSATNYLLNSFYWLIPMFCALWVYSLCKTYKNGQSLKGCFYALQTLGFAGLTAGLFFIQKSWFHFLSNVYLQITLGFSLAVAIWILWKQKKTAPVFIIPGMFLIFNQFHYSLISLNVYPFSMVILIVIMALNTTEVITMSLLLGNILKKSFRRNIETTERLHQMRNKLSADLHDELGSVLTQISLQTDMVNSGIYSEEEKTKELENISATSRKAIHAMSDIVWSVKTGHDKIASLIDRMKDHADVMLKPLNAMVHFNFFGLNEDKTIDNYIRQELYLIYKEAVHNAVKHSNLTQLHVSMGNTQKGFQLTVQNDINTALPNIISGGNGLQNMQQRAQNINAKISYHHTDKSFTLSLRGEFL